MLICDKFSILVNASWIAIFSWTISDKVFSVLPAISWYIFSSFSALAASFQASASGPWEYSPKRCCILFVEISLFFNITLSNESRQHRKHLV
jgi:hypothetical protein